ncbi:Putative amino acid permease F13H10.3-like Protein [Tribolium castaneum]|nr:PREDICTED: uncharacterized protein LOC103313410 [Tribolium castaneum]KYB26974.1 Putative amino acid permease F13H10.3-like Protein [Tribolium castaneum]|eukprot:XP_008194806.1 PREDICTED: uncharacterized protein LOC103313410 [Tribolium castaneum]
MDEENNGQIANYLLVCPRDCEDHTSVLQLFRRLKPPNCPFIATRVWSRDTRKQKCCMWGVLYQSIDETPYLQGTQAKELRKQLNAWRPIGGEIVDYEFYQNQATNESGWVFTWRRLACTHQPHFPKQDNTRTEELKMYM